MSVFEQLTSLHEELAGVIERKIDAVRRNDFQAVRDAGACEQALVTRIQEREGLRRQLVDAIGDQAGWPAGAARRLSAAQFSERLDESQRAPLSQRVEALRSGVAQVSRMNRVASAVCRNVLTHMKWVFAAIRPADGGASGYTGAGTPATRISTQLIDAVG